MTAFGPQRWPQDEWSDLLGPGQFEKDLDTACRGDEKVVTSDIQDREGILPSIKNFLGKGR